MTRYSDVEVFFNGEAGQSAGAGGASELMVYALAAGVTLTSHSAVEERFLCGQEK